MAEMHFTLTSPSFGHAASIPAGFTCDGEDVPPRLDWMHAPPDTESFAVVLEDQDARQATHWVLFDIPATSRHLDERDPGKGIPGRNDFQGTGYRGPCPPPNAGDHRYVFHLYALNVKTLGLSQGATRAELQSAMDGHLIDHAELMCRFKRGTY